MASPQVSAMDEAKHRQAVDALAEEARTTTMVSCRVPTPVYDDICRVATVRGTTASAIINAALRVFLQNIGARPS